MGFLTDIEWSSRKNNHLKKLIKDARFDQPRALLQTSTTPSNASWIAVKSCPWLAAIISPIITT
jgi:hypothetical protein